MFDSVKQQSDSRKEIHLSIHFQAQWEPKTLLSVVKNYPLHLT